MFRDEFPVKKKKRTFDERWGLHFFPAKTRERKELILALYQKFFYTYTRNCKRCFTQ